MMLYSCTHMATVGVKGPMKPNSAAIQLIGPILQSIARNAETLICGNITKHIYGNLQNTRSNQQENYQCTETVQQQVQGWLTCNIGVNIMHKQHTSCIKWARTDDITVINNLKKLINNQTQITVCAIRRGSITPCCCPWGKSSRTNFQVLVLVLELQVLVLVLGSSSPRKFSRIE